MSTMHEALGPCPRPVPSPRPDLETIAFDWDRGGWNNIVMGVEVMVCLARMFDRALVMPDAAKWYFLSGETHLFDFYDEATFKSFVPTSQPKAGTEWIAKGKFFKDGVLDLDEIRKHREADHWVFPKDTRMFSYFPLAFTQPKPALRRSLLRLWSLTFGPIAARKATALSRRNNALIRNSLRIRSELIDKAIELLDEHDLRTGEFVALHVRRNDFQYEEVLERRCDDIADHVTKDTGPEKPILILSDVYDQELIDCIRSRGNRVVCWSQKEHEGKKVKSNRNDAFYSETVSKEGIVLDMLCAAAAARFHGSPSSTFSSRIALWRGLLSRIDPRIDDTLHYTMPFTDDEFGTAKYWWSAVDRSYWA